ncbi:hypothetical protein M8C21_030898, partial [Ambrosia artemisiifolia]
MKDYKQKIKTCNCFHNQIKKMENIMKVEDEVNLEVVQVLNKASEEVVKRVDLSGQQLKFLPEEFGKLNALVHLNLSNNHLQVLPDSIAGLLKLEELDVSSNLLESLPDSIGLLTTLKVLNVSSNKLNTLPESIAFCKSLVELHASFNNLNFLPTNFGYGLTNLKLLSISLNELRFLPTTISELESLKYLDVHFNKLHGIPSSVGKLTNLETLNLSSNFSNLTELPDAITDLANLKELDLSNNQIQVLPESFGQLQSLTKLNLDQNPLVVPPMEIVVKGTDAVKSFMIKWRLENIAAEEQRRLVERNDGNQDGWLSWGTNMLEWTKENPLVKRISLPRVLLFEPGGSSAEVLLYGGKVVSWKNSLGEELLFMSKKASGKFPKGGISLCFPQLGNMGIMKEICSSKNHVKSLDDIPLRLSPTGNPSSVDLTLKTSSNNLNMWPR